MPDGPVTVDFLWICGFVEGPGKSFVTFLGWWKRDPLKGLLVTSNQRMKRSLWITSVICFSFYQQLYKSLFIICVYFWFNFSNHKKIKQANKQIRYSEHLSVISFCCEERLKQMLKTEYDTLEAGIFFCEALNEQPRKPSALFVRQKLLLLGVFCCLTRIGHLAFQEWTSPEVSFPHKNPWLLGTIEVTDHFDHADLWDHSKKSTTILTNTEVLKKHQKTCGLNPARVLWIYVWGLFFGLLFRDH